MVLSDLASARPHVDSLGVGHRGQLGGDPAGLGGHGEEGGDAQGDPGRDGVLVQPEGDPGDDDQHAAGDVDGDEIVGELPLEDELHLETAVLPRVGDHVAVGALVLLQGEPGQVQPRHDLDRVHVLPLVHQVVSRPAVCNEEPPQINAMKSSANYFSPSQEAGVFSLGGVECSV